MFWPDITTSAPAELHVPVITAQTEEGSAMLRGEGWG